MKMIVSFSTFWFTLGFIADQEKGLAEILSKDNLEKLQKEIISAYENNGVGSIFIQLYGKFGSLDAQIWL